MPFSYHRCIRFQETDAAGVVYFANLLSICHEAYEASLAAAGFNLALFFSRESEFAVPVIHTEAHFYEPLHCGEAIALQLHPTQLSLHSFEISYRIYRCSPSGHQTLANESKALPKERPAVKALTRHMCIHPPTRKRQALTPALLNWIATLNPEAS